MKEYGGYMELERFCGREYHSGNAMRFNYCRTGWQYLLSSRGIRKVYIPYYICDSLIPHAERIGVSIEYYHISDRFEPLCEHIPSDGEAILIVNYFGFLSSHRLSDFVKKYRSVIIDNTQAFFARPLYGADTLYSCRKFFGVPDGGYLYADNISAPCVERDRSAERMNFLIGRFEDGAQKHYLEFRDSEDKAAYAEIKLMSETTENILRGIDYDLVKDIRQQNYSLMHEQLGHWNKLNDMPTPDGPYVYPFYFSGDADSLRTYLRQNRIYVPVLWNNVFEQLHEPCFETMLAEHLLPLPVDQRYSSEDIYEISAIVKRGIEEL